MDDGADARVRPRTEEMHMTRVSTYLNFQGQTEEALNFYATAFGTEVTVLSRFSDMPTAGPEQLPPEERDL
ncbi:MAG: hypothetical protein ACRDYC_07340, partial [Acidimicrobiales bacterium]